MDDGNANSSFHKRCEVKAETLFTFPSSSAVLGADEFFACDQMRSRSKYDQCEQF